MKTVSSEEFDKLTLLLETRRKMVRRRQFFKNRCMTGKLNLSLAEKIDLERKYKILIDDLNKEIEELTE